MGLNTSLAEEVRKSTFGREMRKPIVDGLEYESFDEIQQHAVNDLNNAEKAAEDELKFALNNSKYALNSTLVSGKNDLNDALQNGSGYIDSAYVTEKILIQMAAKRAIQELQEKLGDRENVYDYLKNLLLEASENARDEMDSAFRTGKYGLESILIAGGNDLEETLAQNSYTLESVLITETIILRKAVEYGKKHLENEFRGTKQSLKHMYAVLEEDLTALSEIQADAEAMLARINAKCDTRIVGVSMDKIQNTKEYYTMSFIRGDADG